MASKALTDQGFILEVLAILQKRKAQSDALYITTNTLKEELLNDGVSCTNAELGSAINHLILTKKIKLTWLRFDGSTLAVELCYSAYSPCPLL